MGATVTAGHECSCCGVVAQPGRHGDRGGVRRNVLVRRLTRKIIGVVHDPEGHANPPSSSSPVLCCALPAPRTVRSIIFRRRCRPSKEGKVYVVLVGPAAARKDGKDGCRLTVPNRLRPTRPRDGVPHETGEEQWADYRTKTTADEYSQPQYSPSRRR